MGLSSIRFICCRKRRKTKSTGCRMVLHERSYCFAGIDASFVSLVGRQVCQSSSSAKDSNASEEVSGVFVLWARLRAFFTTLAYTSVDQKDWFGFGECEQFVDQVFLSGVARRVVSVIQHPFLRHTTTHNPVVYATKYALQSERDCIAQRLDVAETLHVLADAVYSENLHALRLVDPFLLPVVARRNFLVMREVSVVISWMDPKLIVDLFFGLPQLGWAMSAPTMQLRERLPSIQFKL